MHMLRRCERKLQILPESLDKLTVFHQKITTFQKKKSSIIQPVTKIILLLVIFTSTFIIHVKNTQLGTWLVMII